MKEAEGAEVFTKQDFGIILSGLGGVSGAHFRDLKYYNFGSIFSNTFEDRFEGAFVAVLCEIWGAFWLHFWSFFSGSDIFDFGNTS